MRDPIHLSRGEYANVLTAPVSDIEVARMWRSITPTPTPLRRVRRGFRPSLLLASAVTLAAAAAAFGAVLYASHSTEATAPPWGDDPARHDRHLELPDGSRVTLSPATGMRIASHRVDDLELMITHGAAELAVASTSGDTRRFVVSAGGFEIRGRGARYRVESTDHARVEITVHDGRIEVQRRHGGAREPAITLVGGQSWSAGPPPPAE